MEEPGLNECIEKEIKRSGEEEQGKMKLERNPTQHIETEGKKKEKKTLTSLQPSNAKLSFRHTVRKLFRKERKGFLVERFAPLTSLRIEGEWDAAEG